MIMTLSGRPVKRAAKTTQIVRGPRRAKAPAPWVNEVWSLTESGRAETATMADVSLEDVSLERDRELTAAVAEVMRCYAVEPQPCGGGEDLLFRGSVMGDWARVTLPAASAPLTWRGARVDLPAEAFEAAARLWLAGRARGGGYRG